MTAPVREPDDYGSLKDGSLKDGPSKDGPLNYAPKRARRPKRDRIRMTRREKPVPRTPREKVMRLMPREELVLRRSVRRRNCQKNRLGSGRSARHLPATLPLRNCVPGLPWRLIGFQIRRCLSQPFRNLARRHGSWASWW